MVIFRIPGRWEALVSMMLVTLRSDLRLRSSPFRLSRAGIDGSLTGSGETPGRDSLRLWRGKATPPRPSATVTLTLDWCSKAAVSGLQPRLRFLIY